MVDLHHYLLFSIIWKELTPNSRCRPSSTLFCLQLFKRWLLRPTSWHCALSKFRTSFSQHTAGRSKPTELRKHKKFLSRNVIRNCFGFVLLCPRGYPEVTSFYLAVSRLSDLNRRLLLYKSSALANWAKPAYMFCVNLHPATMLTCKNSSLPTVLTPKLFKLCR